MLFDISTESTVRHHVLLFLILLCAQLKSTFSLSAGDEILSVNGHSTSGLSHSEAIAIFKGIRTGRVIVHVARRDGGGGTVAPSSSSSNISR